MKAVASATRAWIAYAAMTSLFVACYWAFHIVRYDLTDIPARASVEVTIALVLFADWTLLLLFSVVGLLRRSRVGVYGLATTLLFLLMLLLPAMS
jgi:hypothetical protein